jgi:3-hydroxymyristoyl/3-hydroxydecanoyl-(acyl carrier protein) dehydratase
MRLEWNIVFPPSHPAFAGHFPGLPIVPGVLLLDAVLEGLAARPGADPGGPPEGEHWDIGSAKFLRMAAPDEALTVSCEWQPGGACSFLIASGPHRVATGQIRARPGSGVGAGPA